MTQAAKNQFPMPGKTVPSHVEAVIRQKQKAEAREVAGRHKNDGQKDHKGAR